MNIIDLGEKDQLAANIADMKRNMEKYTEMVELSAKLTHAKYKAYIDQGFTEEQAMTLIMSSI